MNTESESLTGHVICACTDCDQTLPEDWDHDDYCGQCINRCEPEHPESRCHRCRGPNIPWCAPSPLWNAVMRGGSIDGTEEYDGIVCPTCFAVLAEQRGIAMDWRVSAQRVLGQLEMVTPSGRIWDEQTWMWRGA